MGPYTQDRESPDHPSRPPCRGFSLGQLTDQREKGRQRQVMANETPATAAAIGIRPLDRSALRSQSLSARA